MRFLLMSVYGDGFGLAYRLQQEGHDVHVWIQHPPHGREELSHTGLFKNPLVNDWRTALALGTVVVFDMSHAGFIADQLIKQGFPVFGSSSFADLLEHDRGEAARIMEEAGIKVPEVQTFSDFNKAREYAKQHEGRLVFKPDGEVTNVRTYVSSDPEDMVEMLTYFESKIERNISFVLQEFVEGALISTEGWFNGKQFMSPWTHTFERQPILNEDLGPSSGCMGNVIIPVWDTNRIIDEGIRRMEPILARNNYIGPIDLNAVVNDEGVWGLEFSPRFGYDAMPTLLEMMDEPIGALIASIATKKYPDKMKLKNVWGGGLRICVPPFPNESIHALEGLPIRGLKDEDLEHIYFFEVMKKDGKLQTSGGYGIMGVLNGTGSSIAEAMRGPYEMAKRLKLPQKMYRTDLVDVFEKDYDEFLSCVQKSHRVSSVVSITAAEQKIRAGWKRWNEKMMAQEVKIEKIFASLFRNESRRVIARVFKRGKIEIGAAAAYKPIVVNIRTIDSAIRKVQAGLQKTLVSGLDRGLRRAGTTMASDSAVSIGLRFPGFPKETQTWLDSYLPKLAGSINNTTRDRILTQIQLGIKKGESTNQIAARIRASYQKMTVERSYLIARQETAAIASKTEFDMWTAMGVDVSGTWQTMRDDRVRDSHDNCEGEMRTLGSVFSNGLLYPRDPEGPPEEVINCRCRLLYKLVS